MMDKQTLPNSTGTLVLGVLSIAFCSCYGIPGIIMAVIAFAISGAGLRHYKENPDRYYGYTNLKAGRICALIGLILNALYILVIVILLSVFGTADVVDFFEKLDNQQTPSGEYYEDAGDYEEYEDTGDPGYPEAPEPAMDGEIDTSETLE